MKQFSQYYWQFTQKRKSCHFWRHWRHFWKYHLLCFTRK